MVSVHFKMFKNNLRMNGLVQYLVIAENVCKEWGTGPIIAQACHATAACLLKYWDDPDTRAYVSTTNLPNMAKVVLKSQDLMKLKSTLDDLCVDSYLWIEQPENMPSALAIKPYERCFIKPIMQSLGLQLLK